VKNAGVVLNVVGIALPVADMIIHKEINGDNGSDLFAGAMAFVPGGGWLCAPLLWIAKKGTHFLNYDENGYDRHLKETRDTPIKGVPGKADDNIHSL
jgi:hypothetical protein